MAAHRTDAPPTARWSATRPTMPRNPSTEGSAGMRRSGQHDGQHWPMAAAKGTPRMERNPVWTGARKSQSSAHHRPRHVPTNGWPRWLRANRGSHPGRGDRWASSRATQCAATGHPALEAMPRLGKVQASSRQPRHDSVMTGLARSEWRTGPARLNNVQTGVSLLKPRQLLAVT